MNLWDWMIILYAFLAMLQDLIKDRISNGFLLAGWAAGAAGALVLQPFPRGLAAFAGGALLPLVLLFLLFYFRMMGAGDIKLLSVLGGFTGIRGSLAILAGSFLIGGALSAVRLTADRAWVGRFRFFFRYVQNYRITGLRIPYRPAERGRESLHFAIPVFAALLLWRGGII